MRSNDIFLGLPYNFVQFSAMQEILAGWLGLKMGAYDHISDSLHVYDRDFDQIETSESESAVENTDALALSKSEFDLVLAELERCGNAVTDESTTTVETLVHMTDKCSLPTPYRNILCVLCAEGARRRNDGNRVSEIMASCTNPAYQVLFTRWLSRFRQICQT